MDKSDETVDYAATQASRQAPGAERAEWTAVAERVVVSHLPPDGLGRPRFSNCLSCSHLGCHLYVILDTTVRLWG